MTIDDVLNTPLSKCYIDDVSYNALALEDINIEGYYRILHSKAIPPCTIYRKRSGCTTLSIPKQTYELLARYLSKAQLTVGDVYLNVPHLSMIPRCRKESARGLYYAFRYLSNLVLRFGIDFDVSRWEMDL